MMLPKLCGMDVELGNFILGVDRPEGSGAVASRALLRQIDGYPRVSAPAAVAPAWLAPPGHDGCDRYGIRPYAGWSYGGSAWQSTGQAYVAPAISAPEYGAWYDPQDWGRKYLVNGGCAYIDLDHLELATPETLSAFDQVAALHALLRVAQAALASANAAQPRGRRILALVNNSDGRSHSYGSHANFLVTREAWDNIFCRRLQLQLALAAFQASSIVFTGQGKVGSENGAPPVSYQLSQRADFFETLSGIQTTYRRPIVNSRDEPLCGRTCSMGREAETANMARLHVIFFDSTLCHVATLLKLGTMQIVLAMIEAGCFNATRILDDPIDAVIRWSHDPTLRATAALADGRKVTAVDVQMLFLEEARRFVDRGACAEVVPRAAEIVSLWERVLTDLSRGDVDALAGQLDWVLKLSLLQRALAGRPSLGWESPQIKHLDHLYSSLDPAEGLYWACERDGATTRLVPESRIALLTRQPPEDTRAWTRGTLLRLAGADAVDDADWDRLRIRSRSDRRWPSVRTVNLENPLQWTAADIKPIFDAGGSLDAILDELEARQAPAADSAEACALTAPRCRAN